MIGAFLLALTAVLGAFGCSPSGECGGDDTDSEDTDTGTGPECIHPEVVESCEGGWCRIEPGCFAMGSPSSEPGHEIRENRHFVTITRPFLMKATKVTQGEWVEIFGDNPSFQADCGDACPVEMVGWYGTVVYCNARSIAEGLEVCYRDPDDGSAYDLDDAEARKSPDWADELDCEGYRLPTEAEWEYAARAGTTTPFYTGDISVENVDSCDLDEALDAAGWYCGNSGDTLHPVAGKQPNGWGLYDVHGNTSEWVWDWYREGAGDETDPIPDEPMDKRTVRGCPWDSYVGLCRAAARYSAFPFQGTPWAGFRVARTVL